MGDHWLCSFENRREVKSRNGGLLLYRHWLGAQVTHAWDITTKFNLFACSFNGVLFEGFLEGVLREKLVRLEHRVNGLALVQRRSARTCLVPVVVYLFLSERQLNLVDCPNLFTRVLSVEYTKLLFVLLNKVDFAWSDATCVT